LGVRLLSALLILGGADYARAATPTVQELLKLQPKQDGVAISTPTEAEYAACTVEDIKTPNGGRGYVLRDPTGRPLRRFLDTNGDRYIDVWSYYLDGQEVYREIDTNFNHKADQYRWFGPGGMKIGLDMDEDGKIDRWEAISPEEVSQEILQAIITRDLGRLQALMINDADIKALELPAAEASRIKEKIAQAPQKFNQVAAALIGLTTKTKWIHLETSAPQCMPADALGAGKDLIRYRSGTILYENAGKHDFLQTGEVILVGRAWKIIDAPSTGYAPQEEGGGTRVEGDGIEVNKETKPLLDELKVVDEEAPKTGDPASVVRYNMARAAVLEKLAEVTKGAQHESWIKQLADSLSAAAQNSAANDRSAFDRLAAVRDKVMASQSHKLAAYVVYREISADYSAKLAKGSNLAPVQEEWREKLKKFVETYPAADDSADAILQLGMVSEFVGKETEAKNWYDKLAKEYSRSNLATKARGARERLELEGKRLELAGPMLISGKPFDIAQLQGKVVIVYYWASWNGQCVADFAKLKTLQQNLGSKGVELVCVNLDNNQVDAVNFINQNRINGIHLFQPGALDSPLAVRYGVFVLPNLFLVGKDGKVVSRGVQVGSLEDEIRKLAN
jgi:thiol-disulfide isomerase/thioredoxin